jgi:hypothetical protein
MAMTIFGGRSGAWNLMETEEESGPVRSLPGCLLSGFGPVWFVSVGFVLVGMVLVGSQDSFGVVEVVGAGLASVEVGWGDPFGSVVMGSFSGGPAGG